MPSPDPLPSGDTSHFLAGRRILIVDGDEVARASAHLLLDAHGCIVESASEGAEACDMILGQGRIYDVIIAAIKLSDMSAADLLLTLKESKRDIPMILMCSFGYDGGAIIVKARHAGAGAMLYKPFRVNQLLETLEKAIVGASPAPADASRDDVQTQTPPGRQEEPPCAQAAPPPREERKIGSRVSDRNGFVANQAAARDVVDCTIFAPPEVRRSEPFLVQVVVHLPSQADAVARDAQEFDDEARRRGVTSLGTEIARGSVLTFDLTMRDAIIDGNTRQLTWQGLATTAQFGVEIPSTSSLATLLGKVVVSQDTVPIGEVTFKLKVASPHSLGSDRPTPAGQSRRYTQAFISYASRDRSEVIRRVQMLKNVGISFFQDVLDLEPGERWAQRLYERIDQSDVLFLFWSTAAKQSEWVTKEWQYALEKKGDDFIRPVGIEGPPIPEPPTELKHLHFGDPLLYFIQTAPKS